MLVLTQVIEPNHAKEKIAIIDNEKRAFDDSIANIDQNLLEQIEDTNDTLEAVRDEYQNRISVQGCRSDLFWRVVGILLVTVMVKDRLSLILSVPD